MAHKLPLVLFIALASTTLVSCIVGSDSDDGSSGGSSGRGGATSGGSGGGSASGGKGGSGTGGTAGSGTGGSETGGSAGSGTGGTGGSGTAGSEMGGTGGTGTGGGETGGTNSGGTGGQACCLAIPTCNEDEMEVPVTACLGDAPCRQVSLCCSTIWCAPASQCGAIPVCDEGDEEIEGECPASSSCYTRTLCGTTITCEEAEGAACNPEEEPDRNYVGSSPDECALIDFACPEYTEYFSNDCGCGCEQDADCPDVIDCMPGPEPRPGCSTEERARCPYTIVAF